MRNVTVKGKAFRHDDNLDEKGKIPPPLLFLLTTDNQPSTQRIIMNKKRETESQSVRRGNEFVN